MIDKDKLFEELGLDRFSPQDQDRIYEDFTYELGAAISDGLNDEQLEEFTQIINGNDDVIVPWLAAHTPAYHEDPSFQELQIGYDEDPEKVSPEKVFASIAWVRVNRPDFKSIVARTKREFKTQLDEKAAEAATIEYSPGKGNLKS